MIDRYDIRAEENCGFLITEGRKKLWVAELDMLEMLEKTCLENDIDYFLLFGSAIGVVRHQGFIPWDDDIDIGMLREDFERFIKCDKKHFPDYIEIQYGVSEHGVDPLLRIRDNRTTGIIRSEIDSKGSKGAFIEIYVFDYVNKNKMREKQLKWSLKLTKLMCAGREKNATGIKAKVKNIFKCDMVRQILWKVFTYVCKKQNGDVCEYVDTISLPAYAISGNHLFKKEDVEKSIYMPFEYTKTRIPVGYDNCLSTRYGNYMELPPIEQRGTHHNDIVFYDPDVSYLEYENTDIVIEYFKGDFSQGKI